METRAGKLSLQPEALGAGQEATNGLKHPETRPLQGVSGPHGPERAVNTEQASKDPMWKPTRPNNGEGRFRGGSERDAHPVVPPGYTKLAEWLSARHLSPINEGRRQTRA